MDYFNLCNQPEPIQKLVVFSRQRIIAEQTEKQLRKHLWKTATRNNWDKLARTLTRRKYTYMNGKHIDFFPNNNFSSVDIYTFKTKDLGRWIVYREP